jgi:hypothetical protein
MASAFVGRQRRAAGASRDVRATLGSGVHIPLTARYGPAWRPSGNQTALEGAAARPSLRASFGLVCAAEGAAKGVMG